MKFGVVIVNYKSAALALSAARSALGDDPRAQIVIVDNASPDQGVEALRRASLAPDRLSVAAPIDPPRPVRFARLAPGAIAFGEDEPAPIAVIAAPANRGFAAGCNLGLAALERRGACDAYLLLNPDALIAQGAFAALAARLGDTSVGLVGASVLRHEAPHCAQALGGASLRPWSLLGRNLHGEQPFGVAPARGEIEARLDYPLGAAIAFRRDYLHRVGPLDERYFLYYEEADWARAGAAAGLRVGWACDAVVYHRHGASAGSREAGGRSAFADYHMARSRIRFAAKWTPWRVPAALGVSLAQAARRVCRGRLKQAGAVLRGAFGLPVPAIRKRTERPGVIAPAREPR